MQLLGSIFVTILIVYWCSADDDYHMCYGGVPAAMQEESTTSSVIPMRHTSARRLSSVGRDFSRFLRPSRFVEYMAGMHAHNGPLMVATTWWDDGCRIQCQMYGCATFNFDQPREGKPGKCVMYRKGSIYSLGETSMYFHIADCDELFCAKQKMREPGYWVQYLLEYNGPRLFLAEKKHQTSIQYAVSLCLNHPLCNLFTATTILANRTFTIRLYSVVLAIAQNHIYNTLSLSVPQNPTVRTVIFHECQPQRPLIVHQLRLRPPQSNDSCLGRFVYSGKAPGHIHSRLVYETYYQSQSLCLSACFMTPGCTSVIYELLPVFIIEMRSSRPVKCVVMVDDPRVPDSWGVFHGFLWKWQCVQPQVPKQSQLRCKCTKKRSVVLFSSKCNKIVPRDNVTLPNFTGLICTGYTKIANGQQWTQIQNPFFPAMKNVLSWVSSHELALCDFGNCKYYAEAKKNKVSFRSWYPPPPPIKCLHERKSYPLGRPPRLIVIEEASNVCYSHVCAAVLRQMHVHLCYFRHWCCSPWNYFISNDGKIFEGQGPSVQPQSLNSTRNRHMLLVAFLGNFNRDMPMPSALQALHFLVSHLKKTKKLDMAAHITTRGGKSVGRPPGVFLQQLIERDSFNNPSLDDSSNECPSPLPYTHIICFYITCCFALMSLIMATLLLIWKDGKQRGLMVCKFYYTETAARFNNTKHCQMCSETIFQGTMKMLTQNVNKINAVTLVAKDMDLVDAARHKFIGAAYRDAMVHTFLAQVADVLLSEVSAHFYAVLLENAGGTELRLVTACGVTETADVIVSAVSQTEGWSQSADSSRWKRYFIKSATKMTVPRGKFCSNQCFWQFVRCIPYADMLNASVGGLQHLQMDRIDNMSRLIRPCDTLYTSSWDSCPLQYLEPDDEQNLEPDDEQNLEPDDEHSMIIGNMV